MGCGRVYAHRRGAMEHRPAITRWWQNILLMVRALYLAIVSPRRFGELARSYFAKTEPPIRWNEEDKIRALRRLWLGAFIATTLAITLGASLGRLLQYFAGPFPASYRLGTQYIGGGLVLLSVMGRGGWAFQTMDTPTLHEKVNDWVYLGSISGRFYFSPGMNWLVNYARKEGNNEIAPGCGHRGGVVLGQHLAGG